MTNDFLREIDVDAFLADLAELEKECGDWRTHIGLEAACTFKTELAIREFYSAHVSQCAYCQEMI